MAALTIAWFTLKKALREKVYFIFLFITLVVIMAAGSVSFYQTGVQLKFLKDVSMLTISTFGFLLTTFLGSELLPFELETRGVHFLASKPMRRLDIVLGKFIALFTLVAANLGALALEVFLLVWLYSGNPDWGVALGASLVIAEMAVFGAIVLFISVVASRLVALFAALLVYVVGHVSDWIVHSFLASSPGWLRGGAEVLLALVPDLSHFDSRYLVVHDYRVPADFAGWLLLYAAVYIVAFLMATRWVLESKEL